MITPITPIISPSATVDYPPNFGVRVGRTKVYKYGESSYLAQDFGRFKDKKILITKNTIENKLTCIHYYLSDKHDKWIKSKMKTINNGVTEVVYSSKEMVNECTTSK